MVRTGNREEHEHHQNLSVKVFSIQRLNSPNSHHVAKPRIPSFPIQQTQSSTTRQKKAYEPSQENPLFTNLKVRRSRTTVNPKKTVEPLLASSPVGPDFLRSLCRGVREPYHGSTAFESASCLERRFAHVCMEVSNVVRRVGVRHGLCLGKAATK